MDKKEGDNTKHSSRSEKKQQEEQELSRKALLDGIIKKIDYYSQKNTVTDLDLYYLMKEFFRIFLELKYEFSFDELIEELDKIYLETKQREEVVNFINKIKVIEYHDSPFKEDKIKEFIKHFSEISKALVKAGTEEKQTLWKKLKKMFHKENLPVYEDYTSASAETFTHKKEEKKKPLSSVPIEEQATSELEEVTEKEYRPEDRKADDLSAEELEKYKVDEPKKKYLSSSSESPDLASIEAHNRMVLGKKDDEVPIPIYNKKEESKKKDKSKKSKTEKENKNKKEKTKSSSKKEEKATPQLSPSDNSWTTSPDKKEEAKEANQNNTITDAPSPKLSEDTSQTQISAENNKADTPSDSNAKTEKESKEKPSNSNKSSSDEKNKNKVKKEAKKKEKKEEKKKNKGKEKKKEASSEKTKSKKEKPAKKDNKLSKKEVKKEKQTKAKATDKKEKSDIDSLIQKAKKTGKKDELTDIYKKVNEIYNKGDVKFKSKYYKSIMDIYKKISRLK